MRVEAWDEDTWKAKQPGSENMLFLIFFEGWVGFRCRFDTVSDVILSRMLAALRASASSHRAAVASVLQGSGQGWAQAKLNFKPGQSRGRFAKLTHALHKLQVISCMSCCSCETNALESGQSLLRSYMLGKRLTGGLVARRWCTWHSAML